MRVQAGLAFVALVGAIFLSPANRQAIAQGYGITLASLNTRLLAVENKTQYVSVTGGEMYVKGTNLHIENGLPNPGVDFSGLPFAPTINGKGNLIIGYNNLRSDSIYGTDIRTGSHNLILGDLNNYSSYDGIVAGFNNNISAPYASVSGGVANTANSYYATVSGGQANTASNYGASVSGGQGNIASGNSSSVRGGGGNTSNGDSASIIGGAGNVASKYCASVSGGLSNIVNGSYASISGGEGNTVSGNAASISGGGSNSFANGMAHGIIITSQLGWAAGGTGAGTY